MKVKIVCKFCDAASSKTSIKLSIKPRERSERGKKMHIFLSLQASFDKKVGILGHFQEKVGLSREKGQKAGKK